MLPVQVGSEMLLDLESQACIVTHEILSFQVGSEMLQKEIIKAYEHKIRQQVEAKIMQAAHQVERQVKQPQP